MIQINHTINRMINRMIKILKVSDKIEAMIKRKGEL